MGGGGLITRTPLPKFYDSVVRIFSAMFQRKEGSVECCAHSNFVRSIFAHKGDEFMHPQVIFCAEYNEERPLRCPGAPESDTAGQGTLREAKFQISAYKKS